MEPASRDKQPHEHEHRPPRAHGAAQLHVCLFVWMHLASIGALSRKALGSGKLLAFARERRHIPLDNCATIPRGKQGAPNHADGDTMVQTHELGGPKRPF